jgi:hypothetical protein
MSFLNLFVPLDNHKMLVIPAVDAPRIVDQIDEPIPCGKDAKWQLTEW